MNVMEEATEETVNKRKNHVIGLGWPEVAKFRRSVSSDPRNLQPLIRTLKLKLKV